MCLAAGVGGAGSVGAARHHSCCKNSSIVYLCVGSTQSRWVIRSFAESGLEREALWFTGERTGCRDVVPPGAQEGIMSTGDLFSQNVDALVVEWGEAAKKCVEDATKGPHIHALGVAFVLDNLWGCVSNSAAWRHRLFIPHDLAETKVGDLDFAYATTSDVGDEFAFIFFVFVELLRWGSFGRDDWYLLEKEVLRFDIPVNDSPLFVHITNTMSNLEDDVTSKILAEVCQFYNLVEQLSTFHH